MENNWLGVIIGGIIGLAGSAPSWGPWLLKILSGRRDAARSDASAHEANRVRFETAQQARIENLVAQLDKREAAMLNLVEQAASSKASLEALKSGMGAQLTEIGHAVNGTKAALEAHVTSLTEQNAALLDKVQRLERAARPLVAPEGPAPNDMGRQKP